ncbi:MAG: carbonic anhydrase family protein [Gammaproteobacteria bacterium]|nr:carbonic anhydrase family protein [Gammaproteobacteria bacterium]MDH3985404.1 carbonic anhydrase family protein [Gammaproteobacteria bacterium]
MNTVKSLLLSLALALPVFWVSGVVQAETADVALTREAQAAITPARALEMLQQGNERFVSGKTLPRDFLAQVRQTSTGQYPFAAIVSCLDSRIPPAIVFDQGIGDLFVGRMAGNFVNDDMLGSLEFATKLSGAKLVVILGHTECGAIKGACDAAQLGLLTATLANINPAIEAVQGDYTPRNSANAGFVQAAAEMNVQLSMKKLLDRSVVLREMVDKGELGLVGAMYDVTTGKVKFYK